jgi:o-succinylbenzoate---CoA ligase
MEIDWLSNESIVLLNPRMEGIAKEGIPERLPLTGNFAGHIWLATSGSTAKNPGVMKFVALSKEAFLNSAEAVNKHLGSDERDVWINSLPLFHVGGLGILARCHMSGAKVCAMEEKWDPVKFHEHIIRAKGTLSSLVPAQIYDLVSADLKAPPSLRAIVVGGGHLPDYLYAKASKLGWVLLPSYGMTESCSQVATAELKNVDTANPTSLKVLSHLLVKVDKDGFICLKGSSLLTSYGYIKSEGCELIDPISDGWFRTADQGELSNEYLKIFGREADFLKIGGESVDMVRLEGILQELKLELGIADDVALVAIPDDRLGHVIHMAIQGKQTPHSERLLNAYQQRVMPYEKAREIHFLDLIPRSPLKKLLREQLLNIIFQSKKDSNNV